MGAIGGAIILEEYTELTPTNEGYVRGLYTLLQNREPSSDEVGDWLVAMENGSSRTDVFMTFLRGDEYRSFVIDQCYAIFLSRLPGQNEKADWLATNLDVHDLYLEIGNSAEALGLVA